MKKGFVRATVGNQNLQTVQDDATVKDGLRAYLGLVSILADALDYAAGGGDCWVTLGLSRDKGALLLTVNNGGSKLYASGATLTELSAAALELLD